MGQAGACQVSVLSHISSNKAINFTGYGLADVRLFLSWSKGTKTSIEKAEKKNLIIPLSLRKKETYNPFKKTGTTSDLSLILLGSGLCNIHVRPWLYSSTSTSPMSSNEGTIKLPARITTTHSGTSSTPRQKWLIRMVIQNTTTTTNSNKWRLFIGISKERRLVSRQLLPRKLLQWDWRN